MYNYTNHLHKYAKLTAQESHMYVHFLLNENTRKIKNADKQLAINN